MPCRRPEFDPWVRKIPWKRKWQPTPVFLPGKSYGQRILAGYSLCVTSHTTFSWVISLDMSFSLKKKKVRIDILASNTFWFYLACCTSLWNSFGFSEEVFLIFLVNLLVTKSLSFVFILLPLRVYVFSCVECFVESSIFL